MVYLFLTLVIGLSAFAKDYQAFLQELSDEEKESGFFDVEDEEMQLDSDDLDEVSGSAFFFLQTLMEQEEDDLAFEEINTDDELLDSIFYEEEESLDADELFDEPVETGEPKGLEGVFDGALWEI